MLTIGSANYDKYDDISNYRLDRIADIKILDETVKPFELLKWADGKSRDLAAYMKEHPYMYSAGNVRVKFRICRDMVSDVIDLFGSDILFSNEEGRLLTVIIGAVDVEVKAA